MRNSDRIRNPGIEERDFLDRRQSCEGAATIRIVNVRKSTAMEIGTYAKIAG
jgi:hypothetical protein